MKRSKFWALCSNLPCLMLPRGQQDLQQFQWDILWSTKSAKWPVGGDKLLRVRIHNRLNRFYMQEYNIWCRDLSDAGHLQVIQKQQEDVKNMIFICGAAYTNFLSVIYDFFKFGNIFSGLVRFPRNNSSLKVHIAWKVEEFATLYFITSFKLQLIYRSEVQAYRFTTMKTDWCGRYCAR